MKANFQIITIQELRQNLLDYKQDFDSFWIKVDRINQQPQKQIDNDTKY